MPNVPINFFDLLVLGLLVFGAVRGRKRGISEELLDVFQWLTIIEVAVLFYKPLGDVLIRHLSFRSLVAYFTSYVFFVLFIKLVFSGIKQMVGEKLVASDVFGRWEYVLGMISGIIRYAAMIVVFLALLNARYIGPEERAAQIRAEQESFGSITLPSWGLLQEVIFNHSLSGHYAKLYLNEQLMAGTAYAGWNPDQGLGARRERLVNEAGKAKTK